MMGFLASVLLMVVGALCAAEDIQKRRPGVKMGLDALSPFQGYIGAAGVVAGLYTFVQLLMQREWFWNDPFVYLASVVAALLQVATGALLSSTLLQRWVLPRLSPAQQTWWQNTQAQIKSQQVLLGYAALGLGLFQTLLNIVGAPAS